MHDVHGLRLPLEFGSTCKGALRYLSLPTVSARANTRAMSASRLLILCAAPYGKASRVSTGWWVLLRPRKHAMPCLPRLRGCRHYRLLLPQTTAIAHSYLYGCCHRARHDDGSGSLAVPDVLGGGGGARSSLLHIGFARLLYMRACFTTITTPVLYTYTHAPAPQAPLFMLAAPLSPHFRR